MKNYLSFMMLTTLFISSAHAFMSGIKPDLDGGAALEIIDGVIHKGPPNSPVSVGYGTFKNNTGKYHGGCLLTTNNSIWKKQHPNVKMC